MGIFKFVKKHLKKEETPDGYCPNCWGRQEYEGKFLKVLKDEGLSLKNVNKKKGWIQAYAKENFQGIKLKKIPEGYVCPNCKVSHKKK